MNKDDINKILNNASNYFVKFRSQQYKFNKKEKK
jgi:hypothetical protein